MDEKRIMDMLRTEKASIRADINPRVKESRIVCEGRGIDILALSIVIADHVIEKTAHASRALLQATNAVNSTN